MKNIKRESRALPGGSLGSDEKTEYENIRDERLTKIDNNKKTETPIHGAIDFMNKECGENGYHSYDENGKFLGKTIRVGRDKAPKKSNKFESKNVEGKRFREDITNDEVLYVEFGDNDDAMYGTKSEVVEYLEDFGLDPEDITFMEDETGEQIHDVYAALYD